ncbi:CBS domain-containing protein [Candidatus Bathyarchaeota archaeon]|nr:CBS domain-containing protein [Candidatus Bathyarchaeota archaeon]
MSKVLVRDVMIRDVLTIGHEEKVALARLKMLRHGVGALPVIEEDHTLAGILTMRDIEFAGPDVMNLLVSDLMTKDNLVTITEATSLTEVADIMCKTGLQRLPVVDGERKLIGLMTQSVVIVSFRALFK